MRHHGLAFAAVAALGALLATDPQPAGAGLVAYWTFDDGTPATPSTTAADIVGGHTGTLNPSANPPVWTNDAALTTYANPWALSFDANNDYVEATG
ncbi:MAG TPA: hypothetical protein VNE39_07485, partial [Planctomycetota bacterium]|nr:hypothetical protein [Planctomycetota bacterium]